MKEALLQKHAKQAKERDDLLEEVKAFCQDNTLPLPERWEVFVNTDAGDRHSYIQHFTALDKSHGTEWEDMFNDGGSNGRNEYISMPDKISGQEYDMRGGYAYDWVTEDAINALKEFCLSQWMRGYKFDW